MEEDSIRGVILKYVRVKRSRILQQYSNSTASNGKANTREETTMLSDLSERLIESLSRRSFLGRLTYAAGALALTLLGVKPAYAYYATSGCNLCYNPATCSYTGCA